MGSLLGLGLVHGNNPFELSYSAILDVYTQCSVLEQVHVHESHVHVLWYRAVSRDVTRTNYDVAQNSGHFGAHRKCMGEN